MSDNVLSQAELTTSSKSVESYLQDTNYSVDEFYVPSAFSLEFVSFIKLVDGGMSENKTPVVHFRMLDRFIDDNGKDTINLCHRGLAKALALDTQLPTPDGWKTVNEIEEGDSLFDEHGQPTKVLRKSEIFNKPMYRLTLKDGRTLDVSEDHINTVIHRRQKRENGVRVNYLDRRNLTTKELLNIPLHASRASTIKNPKGRENRVWLPLPKAVNYPEKDLPIDPYTLGLCIGDGSMDKSTGYCRLHGHVDDLTEIMQYIPSEFSDMKLDKRFPNVGRIGMLGLGPKLKQLGLACHGNDKFIPEDYKLGSIEQRFELLKGLMDTDGTVYKNGGVSFTSNSHQLIEDIQQLVWSLGGMASVASMQNAYRCSIQINESVFKLARKKEREHTNSLDRIPLESIRPIQQVSSQCLMVDSVERTFLAGDYVITHNTTLVEYLILYIAVFGDIPGFGAVPYALYVTDSIDNGVKKMRKSLEFRYNNSTFLQGYLPSIKFTDTRWEFIRKNGSSLVVSGHGAKTGVRGTRENGSRPVLALLDDLISDEDARSPTVIASVEDTVYKAIDYALHPNRRKIIWNGTPFNAKDPLYKAVESGAWNVNVFPVCEKFPCTREEFRGSWEDRFDYDYVKKQYEKAVRSGKLHTFNQELMLSIMSEDERVIEENDIRWYNRALLIRNKPKFNFYITTDFATSERTGADYSVISVWAINNHSDWFWVDGVMERQLMDKNIDDLFRLVQIYKPQSVGVEITGQQQGFISWINKEMMERNIYFSLATDNNNRKPGIRPNKAKMERFNVVLPWFKMGKMYFPTEMRDGKIMTEATEELRLVAREGFKSKNDDFLDTITMLPSMGYYPPSADDDPLQERNGVWGTEDPSANQSNGMDSYIV